MSAVTFTDDPLVAGSTPIKATHLAELRAAIDVARAAEGLSPASWTDAVTAGTTLIKPVHVAEMRTALAAVYTAAGGTPPTYTDPTLSTDLTTLKAVHLQELRAAVNALPTLPIVAKAFYHLDALGTVRAVTNAAGFVVRRHDYAPFGEEVAPVISADARRFTGKERDAETGLDYFSARYYAAGTGRFNTVDPGHVGGDVGDPQSWNAYAQSRNNPLKFVDQNGKWPTPVHAKLIEQAFPGLTDTERAVLVKASYDTDFVNKVGGLDPQDPMVSFIHGMSDGIHFQSTESARALADASILFGERLAIGQQAGFLASGGVGYSPDALRSFGGALHTISDRASPAHEGEQPWFGAGLTSSFFANAWAVIHLAREALPTRRQRDRAIENMRSSFRRVFGDSDYLRAIVPKAQ